MSDIASIISDLVRAGVDPDLIGRTAEALATREAIVLRDDGADRRRTADRERKAAKKVNDIEPILRNSAESAEFCGTPPVLEVPEGSSSPTPPLTPNPPKPSPLSPPKGGSYPPKSAKNSRIEYPGKFQILWDTFPHHPNSSKAEAYRSWRRLDDVDQQACLDGSMAYRRWLKSEIERRPRDPPIPCHLVTYINQRRWEAMLEAAQ